ncbi:MAG: biopolymer transporter ExbD [Saprospiraceae bacterium]|nr:biopolymer transporter ExbD [Saprospiraceae bacterium]
MALKKRSKVSAEFSMSSLTDIIFLLLIFFMLTSTLVSQNALNLKLPSSSSKTVAPPSMAISIEKEGRFYFNGKRMSIGEIEKSVRSAIRAAENKQNLTATIFSEQDAPVKYVVQVMDLANRLKLQAILATEPPK